MQQSIFYLLMMTFPMHLIIKAFVDFILVMTFHATPINQVKIQFGDVNIVYLYAVTNSFAKLCIIGICAFAVFVRLPTTA